jgi:Ca2+-binding RTX toxin-like protein
LVKPRFRAAGTKLVLASALAFVLGLTAPSIIVAGTGPSEDVLCSYVELGAPGPADNVLQITTNDYVGEVTIARDGEAISVSGGAGDPIACSGPESPSVANLDRIAVRVSRESLDALILDLRAGVLVPGATPEPDGTSEIEVSLLEAPGTVLSVIGTSSADEIELGSLGGGSYGANLNGAEEEVSDADVTARNAYFFAGLGAGNDRLDASGRAAFATRAFNFAFGVFGGRGRDVLLGNARRNVLAGGRGNDRLVGARLRDRLDGGSGDDRIEARDKGRDVIHCGRGHDAVRADRVDRREGCE